MWRSRVVSIGLGGAAFWLPGIVVSALSSANPNIVWVNLAPVIGLVALALFDWLCPRWTVKWNWVLAGIYVLGPTSIFIESAFAGGSAPWRGEVNPLVTLILFSPPAAILLSFYSAQFFSVIAATIGLPLLDLFKHDILALRRTPAPQ